jgi:hypothetical protein
MHLSQEEWKAKTKKPKSKHAAFNATQEQHDGVGMQEIEASVRFSALT